MFNLTPMLLQIHDLEFSEIEMQVLEGLKAGNESLKKIHRVGVDLICNSLIVSRLRKRFFS